MTPRPTTRTSSKDSSLRWDAGPRWQDDAIQPLRLPSRASARRPAKAAPAAPNAEAPLTAYLALVQFLPAPALLDARRRPLGDGRGFSRPTGADNARPRAAGASGAGDACQGLLFSSTAMA